MKIYIANCYSLAMKTDRSPIDEKFINLVSLISQRMLWFVNPGDIIVTPAPLPDTVISCYKNTFGHNPSKIRYVVPNCKFPKILNKEVLHSRYIVNKIKSYLTGEKSEIVPYIYDPHFEKFVEILGNNVFIRSTKYMKNGGVRRLNHKGHFRSIAEKAGASIPKGLFCKTTPEVISAVELSLSRCGGAMLKQPISSGGTGNCVITYNDKKTIHGAAFVYKMSNKNDVKKIGTLAFIQEVEKHGGIVVEDYIVSAKDIYMQFKLNEKDVKTMEVGDTLLGHISSINNPLSIGGVSIPSTLNPALVVEFIKIASDIAKFAHNLGYRGYMDIDGMVTEDGAVYVNEGNFRIHGSSHIDKIARQLIGPQYMSKSHIIGRKCCIGNDAGSIIENWKKNGLFYDKSKKEGIILTAENCKSIQEYEVAAISRTFEETKNILEQAKIK